MGDCTLKSRSLAAGHARHRVSAPPSQTLPTLLPSLWQWNRLPNPFSHCQVKPRAPRLRGRLEATYVPGWALWKQTLRQSLGRKVFMRGLRPRKEKRLRRRSSSVIPQPETALPVRVPTSTLVVGPDPPPCSVTIPIPVWAVP